MTLGKEYHKFRTQIVVQKGVEAIRDEIVIDLKIATKEETITVEMTVGTIIITGIIIKGLVVEMVATDEGTMTTIEEEMESIEIDKVREIMIIMVVATKENNQGHIETIEIKEIIIIGEINRKAASTVGPRQKAATALCLVILVILKGLIINK